MKKLLALTAVIGSTVAIAGCNGMAESKKMFKELGNTVNVEGNYLKIATTPTSTFVDPSEGYTSYNDKMRKTIKNTDVSMKFFDKMYENFDFAILGKEQQKKITVENAELDAKVHVTKIDSKNPGYSLEFTLSGLMGKLGGKINVEQVEGFMNVKMHQYQDLLADDTIDFEYYSNFTKNSFEEVYLDQGSYTYGTIIADSDQTKYTTINVSSDDAKTSYAGITSKTVGSVWDGTTLKGFNADKTENATEPFKTEVTALLTGAKMNNIAFSSLTHTAVGTYLRSLIESM